MPNYLYQAINESGVKVTGSIEAASSEEAANNLVARGLIPSKVTAQKIEQPAMMLKRLLERFLSVKASELILFTKQFRTMVRAGVPMLTLLQALENQTENQRLKKIIIAISQDIREGSSLYDAFHKHPNVFSNIYCSMLRAGEASGALPKMLNRLIYIMEHEYKIRSDIRSALLYPAIVIIALILAFFILLTFVVPKFATFFLKADIDLPFLTQVIILMHRFLLENWLIALVIGAGSLIATGYYFKTPNGLLFKDTLLLNMPILGPLFNKAVMARFASIFSVLQSSGMAVLESMRILSDTINNNAIAREFDRITERLEEGQGIAGPLRQSRYFTPIVINMTAIGEESGNLEEMLNDIAEHYDSELEYAVKQLKDSIGPILIIALAVVVGFFALAIYLPLWDITKIAQ